MFFTISNFKSKLYYFIYIKRDFLFSELKRAENFSISDKIVPY